MKRMFPRFCRLLLHKISYLILRAQRWSWLNPKWVLVAALISLIFFLPFSGQLKFLVSAEDLLNPESPSLQHLRILRENFNSGESAYILFKPKSDWRPADFCHVRSWLDSQILNNHDLISIQSPFDIRKPSLQVDADGHALLRYPPVMGLHCEDSVLKPLNLGPWKDLFTSEKADDLAIQFAFEKDFTGKYKTGFDPDRMRRMTESLEALEQQGLRTYRIGLAQFESDVYEALQTKNRLNLLLIFALILIFRAIMGTWRSGFIFVASVMFTCTLIFGAMALMGHAMDVMSSSLFPMTLVATLEDFIFLALLQIQNPTRARQNLRRMSVPSFFTSLTTALGFGSLCVSGIRGVDRFGFWTAMAAMLEWVTLFLVLSAGSRIFPKTLTWTRPKKIVLPLLTKNWFSKALPKRGLLSLLAVTGLIFPAMSGLSAVDSPRSTFPESHPYNLDLNYALESRGWESEVDLLFPDGTNDQQNEFVLSELRKIPVVHSVLSPIEIKSFLQQDLPAHHRKSFLLDFETSTFYKQYFSTRNFMRTQVFLNSSSTDRMKPFFEKISALCSMDKCFLAGELEAYYEMNSKVLNILMESLLVSVLLVLGVLFFLCMARSNWQGFLYLSLTSVWGPTCMLTMIGLLHIPLNYVTCIFASVLVGLTGDNAIQFLFAARRSNFGHGVEKRGPASVTQALVMAVACGLFFISPFQSERNLGWLFSLGFLLAAVGDVWLLQSLDKHWPIRH